MKGIKSTLFLVVMLVLIGGSFWFSYTKNKTRMSDQIQISFTHQTLLLDTLLVNKLLTQNINQQSEQGKESLDLNMLESQLKHTPEIQNIEIYKLPQGVLSAQVTERKPLFEVASEGRFFGDAEGVLFRYQAIDSLRLPVFVMKSSVNPSVKETANLIAKLKKNPLLNMELESIYFRHNQYMIKLRSFPFEVVLGDTTHLKSKIKKLTVFCAFQTIQDSLNGYDQINLSYQNQVVATTF